MEPLIVYTRRNCPLCDSGLRTARQVAAAHGVPLETVDITRSAELSAAYGDVAPAIVYRGELVSAGAISALRLTRYLAGEGIHPRYRRFLARLPGLRRRICQGRDEPGT